MLTIYYRISKTFLQNSPKSGAVIYENIKTEKAVNSLAILSVFSQCRAVSINFSQPSNGRNLKQINIVSLSFDYALKYQILIHIMMGNKFLILNAKLCSCRKF